LAATADTENNSVVMKAGSTRRTIQQPPQNATKTPRLLTSGDLR
jgi:hypothetical protein